jgi:exopolysaccharide biosynthesis polyprenyl glycosylphosphotransferase
VLGGFADLDDILTLHEPERVIIAFSRASHHEMLQCLRTCRDHGVAIDVVPRLFEFLDGVRSLDHLGGLPLLSIGTPRLTRSAQLAKRGLDILVAGAALIGMLPLLAAVAIAIKLDSRGPILFRQQRAGRGREVFELLKFRSMYTGAEERKIELVSDTDDGVMFKMHADPRITRVGGFLRRYSLDELPQLWNVLRGQMSLVGPRPLILPETDALSEDWHLRRLELRPGLTGPWQINGRSETPFHEMVRFDYQYVTGWSLARDLEILLSTLPAVLSGRGAY